MTVPEEMRIHEPAADPDAAEEEPPLHSAEVMRPPTETSIEVSAFDSDWCKIVIHHSDGKGRHRETLLLPRAEASRIGTELLEWAEADDA